MLRYGTSLARRRPMARTVVVRLHDYAPLASYSLAVEAIGAYKRALELKPNYVRALANLGISFANQGLHREAAQAYLATLQRNPKAEHIWGYLRIALTSLERNDLLSLTDKRNVDAFKAYFHF